jgi:glycosyltransferase involved in cell wall biosynthesis
MPNVVLEAMAAGNPVIARRFGGADELVVDGQTGWLMEPDAPARRIEVWLTDRELARVKGAAGRRRVEECFSMESSVRQWESFLSRAVKETAAREG